MCEQRWVRGEDDWHKYLFIHQETVREKYFNDKVLGIKTKPKKGADQPSTPSSARKSGLKKSESMAKLEDPSAAEELGQDAVSMAVMAHKRLSEEEVCQPPLTLLPRARRKTDTARDHGEYDGGKKMGQ